MTSTSDRHLAAARGLIEYALDHRAADTEVQLDLADAYLELALPGRLPDITRPGAGTGGQPLTVLLQRTRHELSRALDTIDAGADALQVARAVGHLRHAQQLLAAQPWPAA
jgi:hypothetical protein